MKTAILIIFAIAALGAVGIVTAISSATDAQADSCKDEHFGHHLSCHGCSTEGQGFESSDGKCAHIERG
jgi:hypothetical protein